MPYSDPEKTKEYQRNYQRQKRSEEVKQPEKKPLTLEDIATAAGVRDLLADTIAEVKAADLDTVVKARCIGYLSGVILKTIEVAELESRITKLEESANIKH